MRIIQHFHDYLVGTKLLKPDDLEVWESDAVVFSTHGFTGGHNLIKRRRFTMNLSVNNVADGFDYDSLEFAVVWWMNVWGPNRDQDKPAFRVEADLTNRRITDIWIGCEVEEKTMFKNGKVCRCQKPNIIKEDIEAGSLPHFLRFVDYGLEYPINDE